MGAGRWYGPTMSRPLKPTKEAIAAAEGARVADVVAPDLDVLFCGINPGLYSGAVGHHFARPGNRFWRTLAAGVAPYELKYGQRRLSRKTRRSRPQGGAFLGRGPYPPSFNPPAAVVGRQ